MTDRFIPYPILCVRQALNESLARGEVIAASLYARDTFDVITRSLLAILVLDGLRHPAGQSGDFLGAVAALTGHRAPSQGYWVQLLEQVVKAHATLPADVPTMTRDAAAILKTRPRLDGKRAPSPLQLLKNGVTFRNKFSHGALGTNFDIISEGVGAAVLEIDLLCDLLEPIWTEFRWELAHPNGVSHALDAASLLRLSETAVLDARVVVRCGANDEALSLHPVVRLIWVPEIRSVGVAVFEKRCFSTSGRYSSDRYVDYRSGRDAYIHEYWHLGDAQGIREAQRDAAALLDPDAGIYNAELDERVQQLRLGLTDEAAILPRDALAKKVKTILTNGDASLIQITGGAGRGKSWFTEGLRCGVHPALASWQDQTIVVHLSGGSRQSAAWFVYELMTEFNRLGHRVVDIGFVPSDLEASRLGVAAALERIADKLGSVLLVVDGCDEILDGSEEPCALDILPDAQDIPEGVHLLLTSRPVSAMGQTTKNAWLRLHRGTQATTTSHTVFDLGEDDAEQTQLVRDVLEQHGTPASLRMIESCQGSALRARHLRRLLELNPTMANEAVGVSVNENRLYDTYFNEVERALGTNVYHRVHAKILAALAVAAPPLPLDIIADIVGLGVEDVYFGALDLGDCLVSMRFEGERLPSLSLGHLELRRYLIDNVGRGSAETESENKPFFTSGHRMLAKYLVRRMDLGVAVDERSRILDAKSSRILEWHAGPALHHLSHGLTNTELQVTIEGEVRVWIQSGARELIDGILHNRIPKHYVCAPIENAGSAERMFLAFEECHDRFPSVATDRTMREEWLRLYFGVSSQLIYIDPERGEMALQRAINIGLVAPVGGAVDPEDIVNTALHRWSHARFMRALGIRDKGIQSLRDALRLRVLQLERDAESRSARVAIVACAVELLSQEDALADEERVGLRERAIACLSELDGMPTSTLEGAEYVNFQRHRLFRLLHDRDPVASIQAKRAMAVATRERCDARRLDVTGCGADVGAQYRYAVECIGLFNCIASCGDSVDEAIEVAMDALLFIDEMLAVEPRNANFRMLGLNLRRSVAQLLFRHSRQEEAIAWLSKLCSDLAISGDSLDVGAQRLLSLTQNEMRSLESGNIPLPFRAGVAVYDSECMHAIGGWTAGSTPSAWGEREWRIEIANAGERVRLDAGTYECVFLYTHGEHHMDVSLVKLFCDDVCVASDKHEGQTGFYNAANAFSLKIDSSICGNEVVIRAQVRSGANSNGVVVFGPARNS
ncbi:MAG: hypothetical protein H6716_26995 [Polyangiaceae bacterium]|nr:hypothetical protein [Polyangiaceae bacterium]